MALKSTKKGLLAQLCLLVVLGVDGGWFGLKVKPKGLEFTDSTLVVYIAAIVNWMLVFYCYQLKKGQVAKL